MDTEVINLEPSVTTCTIALCTVGRCDVVVCADTKGQRTVINVCLHLNWLQLSVGLNLIVTLETINLCGVKFNLGIGVQDVPYWTSTYLTESYQNEYILGIAGKLGVEYFIAPKLSLGGEVSLLMAKQFEKGSYIKTEGYNATTERVESHTELIDPKNSTFYMGTMNLGGKLFMMFYF